MNDNNRNRLFLIGAQYALIAIASFCVYSNTYTAGFVFDDLPAIVNNPDVVGGSSLEAIFSDNFWGKKMGAENAVHFSYRPLTILSFRLNYLLTRLSSSEFHLANMFLHMVVTLLFFSLMRKILLGFSPWVAFCAAQIFALHPIHTGAVCSLVGRAELLASLFALIAFLAYLKVLDNSGQQTHGVKYGWLSLTLILLFCSLLSKETGITMVGVLLVYDFFQVFWGTGNKSISNPPKQRRAEFSWGTAFAKRGLILLSFLGLVSFFRISLQAGKVGVYDKMSNPANHLPDVFSRIFTKLYYNYWHLRLLVWPSPLSPDRSSKSIAIIEEIFVIESLYVLLAFGVFVSLLFFALKRPVDRSRKAYLLGLLWIIIAMVPGLGWFFDVGFVTAERVMYLPSMGYALVLALLFNDFFLVLSPHKLKHLVLVLFVALNLWYAQTTWIQNRAWHSEETLYTKILEEYPENARAHHNLGTILEKTDRKKSDNHLLQAIALEPDYMRPYTNLCASYLIQDKEREAMAMCKAGLAAFSRNPVTSNSRDVIYFNMGSTYLYNENLPAAIEQFKNCIHVNPGEHDCRKQLRLAQGMLANQ